MEKHMCKKGCCTLSISNYKKIYNNYKRRSNKKAGMFIYDKKEDKILLVQSRGNLWGPPKGTLEDNERDVDCAFREVFEEVGLKIEPNEIKSMTYLKNNSLYFYVERNISEIDIKSHKNNDVNGYCWIKPRCLLDFINSGNMMINLHCRLTFKIFMDIKFPPSTFTLIKK